MDELVLIGGGGHCKSCIDAIELENKFKIIGILDVTENVGQKISGYLIKGTDAQIERFVEDGCHFLITLGQIENVDLRVKLFTGLKACGAKIATIISPLAHVSKNAQIGEGSVILHHALVNSNASVGSNCIINTKALIEHDAIIEDHCHISTGAIINGTASIGEKSFVGSNATVVHCAKIQPKSFIKAGRVCK